MFIFIFSLFYRRFLFQSVGWVCICFLKAVISTNNEMFPPNAAHYVFILKMQPCKTINQRSNCRERSFFFPLVNIHFGFHKGNEWLQPLRSRPFFKKKEQKIKGIQY